MRNVFKLKGLERVNGDIVATCEPLDKEETFKATIDMAIDRKEALWVFLEHNWGNVICFLEYDSTVGLYSSLPYRPKLIKIAIDF